MLQLDVAQLLLRPPADDVSIAVDAAPIIIILAIISCCYVIDILWAVHQGI